MHPAFQFIAILLPLCVALEVLTALTIKSTIVWDLTCSLVEVNAACLSLVYCMTYSATAMIETAHSSETLVDFYPTARRYIPEDFILLD
jgi:ABC-type multidrug transport system permease subunit